MRAVSALPDYMAVDAVQIERLSAANSLISRENTGKTGDSRSSIRTWRPIHPAFEALLGEIPDQRNREF